MLDHQHCCFQISLLHRKEQEICQSSGNKVELTRSVLVLVLSPWAHCHTSVSGWTSTLKNMSLCAHPIPTSRGYQCSTKGITRFSYNQIWKMGWWLSHTYFFYLNKEKSKVSTLRMTKSVPSAYWELTNQETVVQRSQLLCFKVFLCFCYFICLSLVYHIPHLGLSWEYLFSSFGTWRPTGYQGPSV